MEAVTGALWNGHGEGCWMELGSFSGRAWSGGELGHWVFTPYSSLASFCAIPLSSECDFCGQTWCNSNLNLFLMIICRQLHTCEPMVAADCCWLALCRWVRGLAVICGNVEGFGGWDACPLRTEWKQLIVVEHSDQGRTTTNGSRVPRSQFHVVEIPGFLAGELRETDRSAHRATRILVWRKASRLVVGIASKACFAKNQCYL